jgi:pimeloyl-ACP methyl ester carboxylesterase
MVSTMASVAERDWWDEWRRVRCPTLVVRGEHGWMPQEVVGQMAATLRGVGTVTGPDTGHDIHLDNSAAFTALLVSFSQRVG